MRVSARLLLTVLVWCLSSYVFAAEDLIRIAEIHVVVHDVFDESNPKENGVFYRTVNRFHINTQEQVVLDQLNFAVGDTVTQKQLDEVARLLRAKRYLRDAKVTVENTISGAIVNIEVFDTWSTKPKVNVSNSGGDSRFEVGLKEENFLGRGIGVGLSYKNINDRTFAVFKLSQDQILNTNAHLVSDYAITSDGSIRGISLEKPFRYYLDDHAYGINYAYQSLDQKRYFQSDVYDQFHQKTENADVFAAWATSWQNSQLRHQVGWHWQELYHQDLGFIPESNATLEELQQIAGALPSDVNLSYPYYQLSFLSDQYLQKTNFDQINLTEDHYIGWQGRLRIGAAEDPFADYKSFGIVEAELAYTTAFLTDGLLKVKANTRFRTDGGDVINAKTEASIQTYKPQSHNFLFFSEYAVQAAHELDGGEQLLLGGDNGLRGYPARFISGELIERLTLEQRYYSNKQIMQMFNFGLAAFVDVAHVSGGNAVEREFNNTYSSAGIGLRVANNRTSISDLIHLDIAFPIQAKGDVDSYQINLTAQKNF